MKIFIKFVKYVIAVGLFIGIISGVSRLNTTWKNNEVSCTSQFIIDLAIDTANQIATNDVKLLRANGIDIEDIKISRIDPFEGGTKYNDGSLGCAGIAYISNGYHREFKYLVRTTSNNQVYVKGEFPSNAPAMED